MYKITIGWKANDGGISTVSTHRHTQKKVRTSADRTAQHQIHIRYFDYSRQPENTTVIGPQTLN